MNVSGTSLYFCYDQQGGGVPKLSFDTSTQLGMMIDDTVRLVSLHIVERMF